MFASSEGWLRWTYDCVCELEHIWTTADLQLELSIYLLTGVVILWLLIGVAWWIYGEAISNLFELKSMNFGNVYNLNHSVSFIFS